MKIVLFIKFVSLMYSYMVSAISIAWQCMRICSGLSKRGAKSTPAMVGTILPLSSLRQDGKAQPTITSCFSEAGTLIRNHPNVYVYLVLFFIRNRSRKQLDVLSYNLADMLLLWWFFLGELFLHIQSASIYLCFPD